MHFMYIARGEGGLLKVGLTRKPLQRGRALSLEFRKRGDRLAQIKFCPGAPYAYGVENNIRKRFALEASECNGFEWFRGLCFDEAYRRMYADVMRLRQFQIFKNYAAA